ncbi:MAG: deoxyhypusine synthase [Candidatus Bathyarchaeota archaeon]|nr:deoxyhypusine synthase [Candidatus Bathyarchaeota archaeon]
MNRPLKKEEVVYQMNIKPNMTVLELIESMNLCGVLGAGRVAKASKILLEMFTDKGYTTFLALAGPAVAGGLRNIISGLIRNRLVNAIVTNGANLTHDLVEALGFKHLRGEETPDDSQLSFKGLGRIGNIYVEEEAFKGLEKGIYTLLDKVVEKKSYPIHELLEKIGHHVNDENSIIASSSKNDIPIFSPGIYDSMLGLHLWTYSKLKGLILDFNGDMDKMYDIIFSSKKIGVIILGGGLPKHFTLGASMLKGGVDAAIQITMDRAEAGSLSGAPLEEAISWRKAKVKSKLVTVIGDFTIVFPLIVASALSSLN